MTWSKIDDQLHSHPKVQRAWRSNRASLGLHLLALSHSGAYLTDGHVSHEFVEAQLPTAAQRRRAVDALVNAGLWEPNGSGWLIHDFLDCNPSREHMLTVRQASRAPTRARARPGGGAGAQARGPTPTPFPDPLAS